MLRSSNIAKDAPEVLDEIKDDISTRKDLKERLRHGTAKFPMACYIWRRHNVINNVKLHWHPEVEIARFESGSFSIAVNMKEYKITGKTIVMVPPDVLHSFILPKMTEESAVLFSPQMLSLKRYDEVEEEIMSIFEHRVLKDAVFIQHSDPYFEEIDELLSKIVETDDFSNRENRFLIKARLLELLSLMYLGGYISSEPEEDETRNDNVHRIKNLLSYIEEHFREDISIDTMASLIGVSREYFCRFFKKHLGVSFVDYLNDYRLQKIAVELTKNSEPIAFIAQSYGYNNQGYFFRIFKRRFDMTPAEYRSFKMR